jgi:hypothetical protein
LSSGGRKDHALRHLSAVLSKKWFQSKTYPLQRHVLSSSNAVLSCANQWKIAKRQRLPAGSDNPTRRWANFCERHSCVLSDKSVLGMQLTQKVECRRCFTGGPACARRLNGCIYSNSVLLLLPRVQLEQVNRRGSLSVFAPYNSSSMYHFPRKHVWSKHSGRFSMILWPSLMWRHPSRAKSRYFWFSRESKS